MKMKRSIKLPCNTSRVLTPSEIFAFRFPLQPDRVFLLAIGEAVGVEGIHWVDLGTGEKNAPILAVVGRSFFGEIIYQYREPDWICVDPDVDFVTVVTADGEVKVEIEPAIALSVPTKLEAALEKSETVMGIALRTTDWQAAFDDAIMQLEKDSSREVYGLVLFSGYLSYSINETYRLQLTYVVMEGIE